MKVILIMDVSVFHDLLKNEINLYNQRHLNICHLNNAQILHVWIVERAFKQSGLVLELPFYLSLTEQKNIGGMGTWNNTEKILYSMMQKVLEINPSLDQEVRTELRDDFSFVFSVESNSGIF